MSVCAFGIGCCNLIFVVKFDIVFYFPASFQTYNSSGDDSYTFLPDRVPRGIGSIRFSITARSDAYIILSPTMEPDEHTPVYEIGKAQRNYFYGKA